MPFPRTENDGGKRFHNSLIVTRHSFSRVAGYGMRAFRFGISDLGYEIESLDRIFVGYGMRDLRLRILDLENGIENLYRMTCGLRVVGCGLRVTGCGLWVAGCGLVVSGF